MIIWQIYLEEGALEKHDTDAVVGLLTMTLMAAVFNTQAPVSAEFLLISANSFINR